MASFVAVALSAMLGLFAVPATASTYEVVYSFSWSEDGVVRSSPAADGKGNIYGYTDPYTYFDPSRIASLYRYSLVGRGFEVVHFFTAEAKQPVGSPVAAKGMVYGVTREGGLYGRGAAFRYDPTLGMRFVSLPASSQSYAPLTGLTVTPSGEAYGVAAIGIYKIDPTFSEFTWVHKFTANVSSSSASMVFRKGLLYGGTGQFYFQFNPANGDFMSLPTDAATLGLTFDAGGGLWSVLSRNVSRFDETPALGTVHQFSSNTGNTPPSGMVLGADGLLYGVTRRGGSCEPCGTLYSINPKNNRYTVVHEFRKSGLDGDGPMGLTRDADGTLYGHAEGGTFGGNVLFRFVP